MSRMDEALQRIGKALDAGKPTSEEDWEIIFEECAGADHIETLGNVQNVIAKNFSFTIEEGAAPYAYYGYLDSENKDGENNHFESSPQENWIPTKCIIMIYFIRSGCQKMLY